MDSYGQKYFISFRDDYSRYMYLYLLHNKNEAFDAFKEPDYNFGVENDPDTFSQAMSCKEFELWYNTMKDEMNSMASNGALNLVELPNGAKAIGCKHQSNPSMDYWRVAKKVIKHLKGTKDYMLMYRQTDNLESFITGLKIVDSISKSLKMYCDNSTTGFLAKNNKSGSRSKHIDIKYLAITKCVRENKMVIEHVSIELMIVDPLIEGMPPMKFKDHVARMGLGCIM
ncbi:Gag-protease-integrase-RT-RNaseH polyprotein, putative [Theobroma cacao]|uniref:Gag-protease-integrase-RT-RNaseH polyprotein, putative n=1 Tax=Theobroma cacao TaxID=3641 RepID=A0A061GHT4_THECC|nr:Gag-protease-integrase-RT-RNaseH polyprotein, putative [Theobroma cacao]